LSVPEAIDKYRLLAKQVFLEKKARGKDGIYKASNVEKAINEVVKWKWEEDHKDKNDPTDAGEYDPADERMFEISPVACKA
jgi:hypothetical protein